MENETSAWLAAIVNHSFDAIVSKTLDGVITSWNAAAERLFGYSVREAIGRHITVIVPPDRLEEEMEILARLRQGETIERFETMRLHRSGHLIPVELSVSPVRSTAGDIMGASTIARDITERKQRSEEQSLVVREMHHRIRNLLTVVQSIVRFSRRQAASVDDFAAELSERIVALAAAHQLILPEPGRPASPSTMLSAVVDALLKPYADAGHIRFEGYPLAIGENALTSFALIFHELATNAVKHGALANGAGSLDIWMEPAANDMLRIVWREIGGLVPNAGREGFGSDLMRLTAQALGAKIDRQWDRPVLTITIDIPLDRLQY